MWDFLLDAGLIGRDGGKKYLLIISPCYAELREAINSVHLLHCSDSVHEVGITCFT